MVLIFKNWNRAEASRNQDYPPRQIMVMDNPLSEDSKVQKYITDRIKLHQIAEEGNIPECTGEERWSTSDTWAVKKEGGVKALKANLTESLAEDFIKANQFKNPKNKYYKEFRPGQDLRCEKYCTVSGSCPQFKKRLEMLAANKIEE